MRSLLRPFRRSYSRDLLPAERLDVTTSDGWRLAVHHVPPMGDSRRGALVLCHGLSANHLGFHFPGRSLASWLARRGWHCFLPDLRGNGASERRSMAWSFDDHVTKDLPAVLELARHVGRVDRVGFVGHSMGGMILFAHGIRFPDAKIARAVTIGSGLDYRLGASDFSKILRLRDTIERLPLVPWGTIAHLAAPLLGRGVDVLERFNVHGPNVEPEVIRQIHALGFHAIPVPLLSSLSSAFEPRGLTGEDGLAYLEKQGDFRLPLLCLGGAADRQVSPEAVRDAAERLHGTAHVHGRASGDEQDYGHWDLLVGTRAPREVWPGVAAFLEG